MTPSIRRFGKGAPLEKSRSGRHARSTFLRGLLVVALCALLLAGGACQSDEADYSSEGTTGTPINLGTAPTALYEGTVGPDDNSYYQASVTGDGITVYTVSMIQLLDDADLAVFEDTGFSVSFCASVNNGTTSESCSNTTSVGTLYIQVKPYTTTGTSYLISVQ